MRASMGGILSMFLLAIFLVVLSSYLLFNVSYAKAFRVKNKIITTYEEYEGNCDEGSECQREIERYENSLGYFTSFELTPDGDRCVCYQKLGYCATEIITNKKIGNVNVHAVKYVIRTDVYIKFPLVQDILGIGKMGVTGQTHEIVKSS